MISHSRMVQSRLPGIYFRTVKPPPRETLPRMDIAALIGFAEAGPQHIPIPIEDMNQYREIFGGNQDLAWDSEKSQMQTAYLAPAVNAFFQNGGKRCWVVRAAQNAQKNKFVIPSIIRVDNWQPEILRARSGGSWSDHYHVGCSLIEKPFVVNKFSVQSDQNQYHVFLPAAPERLSPGSLLRLRFSQKVLFLGVDEVASETDGQIAICAAERASWFWIEYPDTPAQSEINGNAVVCRPGQAPAPYECQVLLPENGKDDYTIIFSSKVDPVPRYGDILQIKIADSNNNVLLLPVSETIKTSDKDGVIKDVFHVKGRGGLWIDTAPIDIEEINATTHENDILFADLLTFSLSVWKEQEQQFMMDELGFYQKHTRFWADLPTDDELYKNPGQIQGKKQPSSLSSMAAKPRFPLSGPEHPADLYIPLGMTYLPDSQRTTTTLTDHPPENRLERDGLKDFSADLFLEKELMDLGSNRLAVEANQMQVQDHPHKEPTGLHSLWNIDEVTLVGIPDAVQRSWKSRLTDPPDLLNAPTLTRLECQPNKHHNELNNTNELPSHGSIRLAWTEVEGAQEYIIQTASDSDFSQPLVRKVGPSSGISLPVVDLCPKISFFRVRAKAGGRTSPWSNSCLIICPKLLFDDCSSLIIPEINLELDGTPQDPIKILWKCPGDNDFDYILHESLDNDFSSFQEIKFIEEEGWYLSEIESQLYGVRSVNAENGKIKYYRVRAVHNNQKGPWSNTVVIKYPSREMMTMIEKNEYSPDDLLSIQRALLAFCAARGDTFSVLSMPAHYRQPDVINHRNFLQVPVYSDTAIIEERDLSFGALYHPWLISRSAADNGGQDYLALPADGAVCGIIAGISLKKGAWVAPANIPLQDIVALEPVIALPDQINLYTNQINLISRSPEGYLPLSADTISSDPFLKKINVRRLLSLLRRLALREGRTFVFEPNDAHFRRRVKIHFENFFEELFTRGAFAGDTPAEAYQVRIDETVNPQVSIDRGLFVIELRVAPSQPLEFMIIQLIQQELSGVTVREV